MTSRLQAENDTCVYWCELHERCRNCYKLTKGLCLSMGGAKVEVDYAKLRARLIFIDKVKLSDRARLIFIDKAKLSGRARLIFIDKAEL